MNTNFENKYIYIYIYLLRIRIGKPVNNLIILGKEYEIKNHFS